MGEAITMRGVTKTFGPKVAVDNLDLSIQEGSLCGYIGPNGAGKTTSIRMIMSIIFPDRGEISVLGKKSAIESKDRIGYLPEERGVYRKMRVGAFLEYMARLKGADAYGLQTRVRDWLERVGLGDCIRKRCQELSKGMQQKVQFVSSIIHEPDLIILDEPFSGLDPVNAKLMRELIHGQNKAGRTIIFSTHVMLHAEQICDHILMINQGKKVIDATLADLRGRFDPRLLDVELEPGESSRGLSGAPGVERVEDRGDVVEVLMRDGADAASVMREVVQRARVRRVERRRASLEDIFIDLVTRSGSAAEAHDDLRASLREHAAGSAS